MKVLVIEDSPTTLNGVCQQLRRMGLEPIAAADAASGIRLFEEANPDLILLDIILPDLDGYEVARRMRAKEKGDEWTPIIFLSARNSDEDLERGIEAGGDDYLTKPVSMVVLGAKVRAMQRISQMRQSLVTLTHKLDAANRELRRLSSIDSLTAIGNRRFFDDAINREWRRAIRSQKALSLVLCDIDFFKQYNDIYGHQAGDECLRAVAATLRGQTHRATDVVTRYGGEEFAVVLPDTDARGGAMIAENMRAAVEGLQVQHAGSTIGRVVTLSCGVATILPTTREGGPSELIQWADAALYEAKRKGRNRVVSFIFGSSGAASATQATVRED